MKNKIEEGTTAGNVGSDTTNGTAPMKKIGAEAPLRRENPLKKQGKKLRSFREIIKEKYISESPVGEVGRTKDSEALAHIESSDLAKEFRKIVKNLGGKNVARQLLAGMNQSGKKVEVFESKQSVEDFIRSSGYKIFKEEAHIRKKEIIFYKLEDTKGAFEDLIENGFEEKFNFDLDEKRKSISYTI